MAEVDLLSSCTSTAALSRSCPAGRVSSAGPARFPAVVLPCLQATAAAVLPMREENDMKRYLLLPSQRRDLLQQGGHLLEAPLGASGIESLLQASARTVSDGSLQRSELCFMASPLVVACHLSCCANWLSRCLYLLLACRTVSLFACTTIWIPKAPCTPLTSHQQPAPVTAVTAVQRSGTRWNNPTCSWA